MQALPQAPSFWQFENAAVINDARTDVTALQRNNPDPPAAAEEVIRGPFTRGTAIISIIGKTFSPFVTVPFLYAAEARPDCVNGVLGVRTKMSKFSREHGRAPRGIYDPVSTNGAFAAIKSGADILTGAIIYLEVCYLCRTPEFAARLHGELEHMRIQLCPVHLKAWQSALVTCADLHAIIKTLIGLFRAPQGQSLFGQLVMSEVMGHTQNPGHVTAAHFRSRFADFAVEHGCLFDDEDACFGPFAFEHQRRRRAGKRAANDHDIVIEVHRVVREWTVLHPNAIAFVWR